MPPYVRYGADNGPSSDIASCLLCARSGHGSHRGIDPVTKALRLSLHKKGGCPLNQPVGRHDPDDIGDGYIKPVERALDEGSVQ